MKFSKRNKKSELNGNGFSYDGSPVESKAFDDNAEKVKKKFSIKKLFSVIGVIVGSYLLICVIVAAVSTLTAEKTDVTADYSYVSDETTQDSKIKLILNDESDNVEETKISKKTSKKTSKENNTKNVEQSEHFSYVYSSDFTAPDFTKHSFHSTSADDFSFDTIRFCNHSGHRGERSISYYSGSDSGYIKLPTANSFGNTVSAIDGAFINADIEGILIPKCITFIDDDSFKGCKNLKVVEFEGNLEELGGAFDECTSLKNIKLPYGIKKLNSMTFSGCTSLSYVEIPKSVETIDEDAIILCDGKVYVYVPSSVKSIDEDAFCDEVVMVVDSGSYAEKFAKQREQDITKRKGNGTGNAENGNSRSYIEYPDYSKALISCSKCGGTGSIICQSCHGVGSHSSIKNAPNYGYGSGGSYSVETKCAACRGNGSVQCYYCGGDGVIN